MVCFERFFFVAALAPSCSTIDPPPDEALLESYCIYWAPTFETPEEFTVMKTADGYFLARQKYEGMGGYSPRKFGVPRVRRISEKDWSETIKHVETGGFWTSQVASGIASQYLDSMLLRLTGRRGVERKEVTQYGEYDQVLYDFIELPWKMWSGENENNLR